MTAPPIGRWAAKWSRAMSVHLRNSFAVSWNAVLTSGQRPFDHPHSHSSHHFTSLAAARDMADTTGTPASACASAIASPVAPLSIYLCASIRGEIVSKPFLNALITHCKRNYGPVLTEHIGFDSCEKADTTDQAIYDRDVAWLKASDVVIAECSSASLGVGYELAYAEFHQKPILVLYRWPRADHKKLSGMIAGNTHYSKLKVAYYKDEEEAKRIIDQWIPQWKPTAASAP